VRAARKKHTSILYKKQVVFCHRYGEPDLLRISEITHRSERNEVERAGCAFVRPPKRGKKGEKEREREREREGRTRKADERKTGRKRRATQLRSEMKRQKRPRE